MDLMSKASNATSQICFRVSPEDHAEIRRLASVAGMGVSAYLLSCALPKDERRDGTLAEALKKELGVFAPSEELPWTVDEFRRMLDRLTGVGG